MEVIPVLYRLAQEDGALSSGSSSAAAAPADVNCFELEVRANKEVLLLDILQAWTRHSPLGANFLFYARASGEKMILLESPSCCVPVINNTIYLMLRASAYVTYTPVDQSISWFEKSQRDVYGTSSINIIDRYRFQQSNRHHKRQNQQQQQEQEHHKQSLLRNSFKKTLSMTKKKPYPSPTSRDTAETTTADAYFDYSDDNESRNSYGNCEGGGRRGSEYNSQSERSGQQQSRSRRQDAFDRDDDDYFHEGERRRGGGGKDNFHEASKVLAGASQATVAAAGTAAKSFFSFASSTMKTMASVTAQGLEVGSGFASAMTGSITIGTYKVAVIKDLAEGGFGKVVLVKDMMAGSEYGKEYALKILLCQTKDQVADAQNEIRMLKSFNGHPNIIRLLDQSATPKNNGQVVNMLFPVYRRGTAWDLIEQHTREGGEGRWPFSEVQCLDILLGTTRALGAMHDAKCLHMDMKPHNILLTDHLEAVVMDLGSAGPSDVLIANRRDALNLEDEAATKCSGPFRAPELYQVPQDFLLGGWVDIWSLGCTMHCLAFGWSPFENAREGVLKLAILNGRYSTPARNHNCGVTFSQGYTDLIQAMLQVDYTARPTAQDVKEQIKILIDDIEGR